jgi:hypothetical protein
MALSSNVGQYKHLTYYYYYYIMSIRHLLVPNSTYCGNTCLTAVILCTHWAGGTHCTGTHQWYHMPSQLPGRLKQCTAKGA